MQTWKKVFIAGSISLSAVAYAANYGLMTLVEWDSSEKLANTERQFEEYDFKASQKYEQGLMIGDETFKAPADVYFSLIAAKLKNQVAEQRRTVEFWRKAKYNPLKTFNMLSGALIYNDPDLSPNRR